MGSSWDTYAAAAKVDCTAGAAFEALQTQHKQTEAWTAVKLFTQLYPPSIFEEHIKAYGAVYFTFPAYFDAMHVRYATEFLKEALSLFRVELRGQQLDGKSVVKIFL